MVTTTIPGLNSRQLLGQLKRVQSDTLGFLMDCVKTYGDLVSFQAGPTTAVFVNQPEGVRHILQDNARNYSKDTVQYNALSSITGRGLLTSDGDLWFRQRRLEQPAFSRPRLAALDTFVVPAVQRLLDHWETHLPTRQSIDVDQHMMQVTLEIVGKALFSIDLSSQAPALTSAVLTTLDHIVHRARNPISLPAFLPTRRNLRFRAALSTLDAAVYDLMAARQEAGDPGDDMLGMLMKARDEETGQPMSERQVRDEVITLLIAGHETVASALTWTFHLLAANPDARQRLENEVHSVLGGRLPTTADLPNLPYTGWVFSEALRLYPPAWLITRKALAEDQISGHTLAPGTLIILSPYVLQRAPAYWPEPERFLPERFEPSTEKARPRYAYIPFGGGPRLCIGSNFAQIEAQLILALVAQRFRLESDASAAVVADPLVTIRPRGGLHMTLSRSQPEPTPAEAAV